MDTLFAPPERDSPEEVRASAAGRLARDSLGPVLDLLSDMAFILNARRQVVFANTAARAALGLDEDDFVGARIGELLDCIHVAEGPGGCGTSESCSVCGAVAAILEGLGGKAKVSQEGRFSTRGPGGPSALELKVTAVAVSLGLGDYVLVTLKDRADASRRQVLERLFFHDVMNGLSSIHAGVSLLGMKFGGEIEGHEYYRRLLSATEGLVEVVNQQRDLLLMEGGKLVADRRRIDLAGLTRRAVEAFEFADCARGKSLVLDCGPPGTGPFADTDPVLLGRVIVNMVKNAMEASEPGEEVRLSLGLEGDQARINVHNSAYMPRKVQLQVFQPAFSTKGSGRGMGTYSMRMLTETYLGGRIDFSSSELGGTNFWVLLPFCPQARPGL